LTEGNSAFVLLVGIAYIFTVHYTERKHRNKNAFSGE